MRSSIRAIHQLLETTVAQIHTIDQSDSPLFDAADWAPTPKPELGDFSIPCFKLAKKLKMAPPQIANELASAIEKDLPESYEKVQAVGPYLNFFQKPEKLYDRLNKEMESSKSFGSLNLGEGKTVAIDFSSPNVAKEIGLHHLRSTAIGNSLARINAYQGAKVERINYLGDWGTSFGKLILGLQMFGQEDQLKEKGLEYMLDLYVQFNKAEKEDPTLSDKAKATFQKLEGGDEELKRVWLLFRETSVEQFKLLYSRLNIEFDYFDGESLYDKKIDKAIGEIESSIGTRLSDGALVCDLEGHDIPVLLKKDDGASLYITRDLAAVQDRWERFSFDKAYYVVAIQQKLHFKQLFDLCSALKKPYADRLEHISYGMLAFGSKTMKSREGNAIFLKDALDEGKSRAKALIKEKNPNLENIDTVADQIGIGALIFSDLSQNKNHTINFEWDQALSFEGDTAPFIQYTHARCNSLVEKTENYLNTIEKSEGESSVFAEAKVKNLLLQWDSFDLFAEKAYLNSDPSQIANALLNVSRAFNQLYHEIRFLEVKNKEDLQVLIQLTKGTAQLLKTGLSLLGIQAPQRM